MEYVSSLDDYPVELFEPVDSDERGPPETCSAELVMQRVALNPSEPLTYGPRRHPRRPTTYMVEFGRVAFETPDERIFLDAGEGVRFGPTEFHHVWNVGVTNARVTSIGVPPEALAAEYLLTCESCEKETIHDEHRATDVDDAVLLRCYVCNSLTDVLPYPPRA